MKRSWLIRVGQLVTIFGMPSFSADSIHIFRRIFDTLKLRQDKKTVLSKHADVLNFNFNKRIKDTRFASSPAPLATLLY